MTRARRKRLLESIAAITTVLLLSGVLLMRPVARANRICRDAEFGPLPLSARELHIAHRGVMGTQSIYLRFRATAEDVSRFIERGRIDPANEPVPMRTLRFGARAPAWMSWEASVKGRLYHINRRTASVWLAIDDDSHTVYLSVHESRPAWFRRLLRR